MSLEACFYLALYQMQKSHQYHWAFLVSPRNILDESVEIFQITQNGGPWERGHRDWDFLMDSSESNLLCCILLSPIEHGLERFRQALLEQPVKQGNTPLTPLHSHWTCAQWCMRTLERLIHGGYITDQFTTQHPRWKEIFYLDVIKAGDRAKSNSRDWVDNGQVRVVPLK